MIIVINVVKKQDINFKEKKSLIVQIQFKFNRKFNIKFNFKNPKYFYLMIKIFFIYIILDIAKKRNYFIKRSYHIRINISQYIV